jgi:hypothetical protein
MPNRTIGAIKICVDVSQGLDVPVCDQWLSKRLTENA